MKSNSVSGVIVARDEPFRDSEGFTSVLTIDRGEEDFFFLSVTLPTAEDHVWQVEQQVAAHNVYDDTMNSGRTYKPLETQDEGRKEEFPFSFFFDLAPKRIVRFKRQSESILLVGFDDGTLVTCTDDAKCTELLIIGIGGLVQLYNVKGEKGGAGRWSINAKSGIRRIVEVAPPLPPLSPPPRVPVVLPAKWRCIVCNSTTFQTTTKCSGCGRGRQEGPLFKVDIFFPRSETRVCCRGWKWRDLCEKCRKEVEKKRRR